MLISWSEHACLVPVIKKATPLQHAAHSSAFPVGMQVLTLVPPRVSPPGNGAEKMACESVQPRHSHPRDGDVISAALSKGLGSQ